MMIRQACRLSFLCCFLWQWTSLRLLLLVGPSLCLAQQQQEGESDEQYHHHPQESDEQHHHHQESDEQHQHNDESEDNTPANNNNSDGDGNDNGNEYHKDEGEKERMIQRGVDFSWPTHFFVNRNPDHIERGRVGRRHIHFIKGCSFYYTEEECRISDRERMTMNYRQPRAMQNYTTAGYAKVRAPTAVFEMLQTFYNNRVESLVKKESWPPGNIYTNHWESAVKIIPVAGLPQQQNSDDDDYHDNTNRQASLSVQQRRDIIAQVKPVLEAWCKLPLLPTSMYGIREYRRGSILTPHVDRLPLIISAIINVGQHHLVEPWPLEIIDHSGMAVNVTMEPGDMVLYEGASIIHGRPYPLNGQTYANLFLHFEPVGHSQRHVHLRQDPKKLFEEALQKHQDASSPGSGARLTDDDTMRKKLQQRPRYVPAKNGDQWEQKYVFVKQPLKPKSSSGGSSKDKSGGSSNKKSGGSSGGVTSDEEISQDEYREDGRLFHNLAAKGMLFRMKDMVMKDPSIVTKPDHNGWLPLHEAARSGHTRVVEYLCGLMDQTEINTRTNGGKGGTPLWWALHMFDEDHPTVKALIKHGARSIAPNS